MHEELSGAIPDSPVLGDVLEVMESATNYRDWSFSVVAPHLGRRVLEVGAGTGTMTACLDSRDFVLALELDATFAASLRSRLSERPNVEVVEGSATNRALVMGAALGRIDSAMSFNVLEHIDDDVAVMRNVHDCLPPGGRFVCFVPALPRLYGALDAALGHYRRYTAAELVDKAHRAGFSVADIHYFNSIGALMWWVNGKLFRSRGEGRQKAIRFYDRVIVPVGRRLESRWRPRFGQSLVLVAEKRR